MNNDDDQRFEFTITVTPRSRGDFGCARIGGLYRSIQECKWAAEEMIDQIKRHVDEVDHVSYTVEDVYQELADIPGWKTSEYANKPFSEVKPEMPHLDNTDYKEEMRYVLRSILRCESAEDMYHTAKGALWDHFEEDATHDTSTD